MRIRRIEVLKEGEKGAKFGQKKPNLNQQT